MSTSSFDLLTYLEPLCCGLVLFAVLRAKAGRTFPFVTALLTLRICSDLICLGLLHTLRWRGTWRTRLLLRVLDVIRSRVGAGLLIILSIFRLAMAPLKGLQTLGMLVFKWAAAISIAIALGMAVGPHQSGTAFMTSMITQLQQTSEHSYSLPSDVRVLCDPPHGSLIP